MVRLLANILPLASNSHSLAPRRTRSEGKRKGKTEAWRKKQSVRARVYKKPSGGRWTEQSARSNIIAVLCYNGWENQSSSTSKKEEN